MEKEILTFQGNRDLWIDFTTKIKRERKEVWEVLERLIKIYLNEKQSKNEKKN